MSNVDTDSATPRADWLFSRMTSFYGSKFADMWRDVEDLAEVKRDWENALRSLSRDDVQRGVQAMLKMRFPPTLPEFITACAPPAPVPMAHRFRLEDQGPRTDNATARGKLADLAQQIRMSAGKPGILWAEKIIAEADIKPVPALKLAFAKEAIANYTATHPGYRAPWDRTRQPGEDDEAEGEPA